MEPLLTRETLTPAEKAAMEKEGHVLLPGVLVPAARARLTESLTKIQALAQEKGVTAHHYAAEQDAYLASLLAHPQLLALARAALGPEIRFDHCVSLIRPGGDGGCAWHSHDYAEDRPDLGFVRIFFYVNGFAADDGGLKVVPGSHLFRDPAIAAKDDRALRRGWMKGRTNPRTGEPLVIETMDAPEGSVVLMWTHAAHAVTPRKPGSPTRWTVVFAYRNPGVPPSPARWITPEFERNPPPGAEGLMGEQ